MGLSKLGQAFSAREIFELIKDELRRVEEEIALESVASVDAITVISRYLQSSGGKRLRPSLLLLSSKLIGNGGDSAIRLGAVVEIVHTATLVHDDVIDAAETRRGRPSTNAQWGNHISVLAGDWLYMQAFQLALKERNFRVLDILIALTQMMVEGELIQLERIGKIGISEADYMELVDRKTAGLFSACARLGALVAGADHATEERLGDYAWNLGMAFQLVDDVLDFTARAQTLGKPVGGDLREGKVTLPLIYALGRATPEERHAVETILSDRNYDRVPFREVLAMIQRYDGFERAKERALAFTEKARQIMAEFPESPYQRALYAITDLVTDRDH
ncbi:MAG: polyprenyl synthetase family protein [Acidobacteria bacterium]|nr:polyprenyl synthetase family protein [Acidobacteriota bacterium]MBI3472758.1 polyprenyl synthetase family protein [Candidatus Solibacter usitatus]